LLLKQKFTDKTKFIWYPKIVIEHAVDKAYAAETPEDGMEDGTDIFDESEQGEASEDGK
jgi:hypothetical protein